MGHPIQMPAYQPESCAIRVSDLCRDLFSTLNFILLAAISVRRVRRLRLPQDLSGLGKPPQREAVAREVRGSLLHGLFYPCVEETPTNQHFPRWSWQCVERQPDFLGGCIRYFGEGLQRRQVTS